MMVVVMNDSYDDGKFCFIKTSFDQHLNNH